MPLFKPMVLSKDRKVNHYSLYVMNWYWSSVDILDSLPYPKNHRPSKNTYHKDREKIVSDIYYLYWINFSTSLFLLFLRPENVWFLFFFTDLQDGPSNEGFLWWCSVICEQAAQMGAFCKETNVCEGSTSRGEWMWPLYSEVCRILWWWKDHWEHSR